MNRVLIALLLTSLCACSFDGGAGAESDTGAAPVDAAVAARPDAGADGAPDGLPDPEAGVLFAFPHSGLAIDGDLNEWGSYGWLAITAPADFVGDGGAIEGAEDLRAELAARYTGDWLYLAVLVTDDVHHNSQVGAEIWRHDSIQIAFDTARNGGDSYDDTDDWELGYALDNEDELRTHRWHQPAGAAAYQTAFLVVERKGGATHYELGIPAAQIELDSYDEGDELGFALIVNEVDQDGERDGYLEWQSGLGVGKTPDLFGRLTLWPSGPDA